MFHSFLKITPFLEEFSTFKLLIKFINITSNNKNFLNKDIVGNVLVNLMVDKKILKNA